MPLLGRRVAVLRQPEVIGRTPRLALPVLFFGSGLASLALETALLRQLSWILGSAVTATAFVVSAFMAGLALGAAAFGRVSDRSHRPLRLYGLVELAAAASGASLVLLLRSEAVRGSPAADLLPLAVVASAAFMGGTLPAVARFAVTDPSRLLGGLGFLYGVNTLGGAAGALLAGFVLIETAGVSGTGLLAAALAGTVGAGALVLDLAVGDRSAPRAPRQPAVESHRAAAGRAEGDRAGLRSASLAAAAACGAASLGCEVVWTRLLALPLRSYAYSFSLMLALFLLGLVVGSLGIAARARHLRDAALALAAVQLAFGVWVASSVLWIPALLAPPRASSFGEFLARGAAAGAIVVLPPTIASGMALPLAVHVRAPRAARLGGAVGLLYAVNTASGIAGALAVALVAIPALGAHRTLAVLAAAVAGSGAFALGATRRPRRALLAGSLLAGVCLLPTLLSPEPYARGFLRSSVGREAIGALLLYRESRDDTIAVVTKDYGFFDPAAKSLLTNGVAMAGTTKPVWRYMAAEGHLPVLLSRHPSSGLAIGIGTGITLAAVVSHPEVERVWAVELSAGVLEALPLFDAENEGAWREPQVRLVHGDGRRFLERTGERFGFVTVEPPPPIVAGASSLYSLDFYRACKRRLEPGGVVAQWLPLHAQSLRSARMAARTFLEAFPFVQLWLPSVRDAVLVGSDEPLALSAERLEEAYREPKTAASLRRAYLETPEALLATFLLDREGIERWAGDARVVTDDRPLMEFFRASGPNMKDEEIAGLLEIPQAGRPFLIGAEQQLLRAVEAENRALRLYLRAEVHGDEAAGIEAARLARGTDFFAFRLGCTADQLAELERRASRGPAWSAQVRRCDSILRR